MAADQSQWYPASLQAVLDTMAEYASVSSSEVSYD